MFGKDSRKERNKRNERIAVLENNISEAESVDYGFGNTEEGRQIESQIFYDATKYDQTELDHLRQSEILRAAVREGISIPQDKWIEELYPMSSILSDDGIAWVERKLKKIRRSNIEFWAKIVLPILSVILSVIALVKKY